VHYVPTDKINASHSHSHSTYFESQYSHSMNVNFDQLHHITSCECADRKHFFAFYVCNRLKGGILANKDNNVFVLNTIRTKFSW